MDDKKGQVMELSNGGFRLGGEPLFVYSGEIHYFRIPKAQWKSRLRALKAAGFNTVSTYIPWMWHEPEEGKIDLSGATHPERDVLGFMDLAKSEGLHLMARVGPVSNAELINEGIPHWLTRDYPDVFVKGTRDVGNLPHVTIISYLSPVFQEKVERWFNAILPEVSSRQTERGGAVIGVQLCNEVAMVHWLQKGSDHKPHVEAMYRSFLQETYKTVAALNQAYGASYGAFSEVKQPDASNVSLDGGLTVFTDWALFYRRYYAAYFHTLSRRARAQGITVPLFCNIPQFYDYDIRGRGNWAPMTTSMFRDFPLLTPRLVFGGAYQMRHLDFENFHDIALTSEITRLLNNVKVTGAPADAGAPDRLPSLPPFEATSEAQEPVVCAELQTGIMRDRPRLYPHQVMLNVKSSVSQGLAGVNAYMFAGGVNPQGFGAFGSYHDWQAPVGPKGEERPHLEPLKDFGRFLKWAGPFLAQTKKSVDTAFGFYLPYWSTEYWSGRWVETLENQRTNYWYDGMARLVHLAGYSYRFAELQRMPLKVLLEYPSLWVYSLEFMDGDTQAKLAEYVKGGGKLMLYPNVPSKDLSGKRNTTLADALGLSFGPVHKGSLYTVEGTDYWVQGPIQTFKGADAKVIVPVDGAAAVIQKDAGRGQVLAAGFGMPHVFDHYREWVRSWGESLGIRPRVECDPWDVQATLRENGDFGFLFLFNYHFTAREAKVSFPLPGTGEKVSLPAKGRTTLAPFSGQVLPLNLPLLPGVRLVYATAEPTDLKAKGGVVELSFGPSAGAVEVVLSAAKKPRGAAVNGKKVPFAWKKNRATLSFAAQGASTKVKIAL